jgi:hypothetical protein
MAVHNLVGANVCSKADAYVPDDRLMKIEDTGIENREQDDVRRSLTTFPQVWMTVDVVNPWETKRMLGCMSSEAFICKSELHNAVTIHSDHTYFTTLSNQDINHHLNLLKSRICSPTVIDLCHKINCNSYRKAAEEKHRYITLYILKIRQKNEFQSCTLEALTND